MIPSIANERMSFFAILGIIEAALRLSIVFLLSIIMLDRLAIYAFLVCMVGVILFLFHKIYCNKTFVTARFRYCKDKELFKQLLGFSGWGIFGGLAITSRDQGANILLNIFHGVTMNAAMGIATQVNSAIFQFVSNFQTAFSPQIIKSYSAKDYECFMSLIFRTAKMSFCLLFFFVLPLYINADFVLGIWLNNVPEYVVAFTRLIFLFSLVNVIAGPLMVSIQATGDMKKYQLIVSCSRLANLPLALFVLWIGFSPIWVLIIRVGLEILIFIWRVFFLGKKINLPVLGFFREVIVPVFIIAGISIFVTVFIYSLFVGDWSGLIVSCVISAISIGCLMYCIGLNRREKILLQNWIKKRLAK